MVSLGRASGCLTTPNFTRNGVLELQRAMPMKISIEDKKNCNQTTIGERPEIIGEV